MLAILNAEVRTCGPLGTLPHGDVLVDGRKIVALGRSLGVPDGARVIDAAGMVVTPGFIDAHTHLGMDWQVVVSHGESDMNESTSANNAHLHAIDSVDPRDIQFRDAVEGGVTTVMIHCGKLMVWRQTISPITGQSVVMKTHGSFAGKEILREPAAMKFAFGEEVIQFLTSRKIGPNSRAGLMAFFRSALLDAQSYGRNGDAIATGRQDLRLEALNRLLSGELPWHVHAHQVIDIRSALLLGHEFGLRMVLHHATEGHLMADELAAEGVACVVGPIVRSKPPMGEMQNLSMKTPAVLARAGVKVALMTDHPSEAIQYLPIIAGEAVREGMDLEEGLKAVTINAAQIMGVADRVGSLEPGKDADLVLHDGEPLEATTHILMVMADGEIAVDNLRPGKENA